MGTNATAAIVGITAERVNVVLCRHGIRPLHCSNMHELLRTIAKVAPAFVVAGSHDRTGAPVAAPPGVASRCSLFPSLSPTRGLK